MLVTGKETANKPATKF